MRRDIATPLPVHLVTQCQLLLHEFSTFIHQGTENGIIGDATVASVTPPQKSSAQALQGKHRSLERS